ncbi:hypothetical protein ABFS82_08G077700 [Erythranthe guttata]|nr:PREDICTED: putative receptor-like protein kinase At5g39000 [Erythranthe guttata]|eukprot:XP_012834121.1 PREDICTED: putative receptor-like protein kinase At5g39000 [Erythranthe guttata]
MQLHPISIPLLLLFFLNAFTLTSTTASNNNQATATSRFSINCGSFGTSAALNGKKWTGDSQPKSPPLLQIKGKSTTSSLIHKLISTDPIPYKTSRISHSQFSYVFQVNPGQKILRLHFNPSPYKGFKRFTDLFTVEAGRFVLLNNFSASLAAAALGVNSFSKEFCLSIEQNQGLNVTFSPTESTQSQDSTTYAFINGIEVISVPMHLSYFNEGGEKFGAAQVVGRKSVVYIDNGTALELIHRLNIKREFASSNDDFDDMFGMWGPPPKPKATEIDNLAWKKPVDVGFRYLVRIHFGDLGLKTVENFEIFINEMNVDTKMDVVKERDERSFFVWYRDYMVVMRGQKKEGKRDLSISIQSYDGFMIDENKIVKGFEIFKLSNPDNSLASPNAALLPPKESPPWIMQNILSVLGHRDAIVTVVIVILSVVNIIVYKMQDIWETSSTTEEENKPSARAERLCRRFSLAEIRSATENFSRALVIGRGGFGKVYRGLIDNGREYVAIKRLKSNSKQGKHEFLTEIETLSELRHINLVSLIGYCSERREMILVYEYMASGTLSDHLYKLEREGFSCSSLTWKQRLNICIGAGRGLDYLHTGHGVIHRDVKSSNILLDENFVAKVSDFGLAKHESRSKLQSHISTKVKGTFGYFDPYYYSTHKLTRKSDTYAYGVVLLEVLCGRPALDPMVGEDKYLLTKWARNGISKGEVDQIVDSSLVEEISPHSLKVFVEIVEMCLHDEPKKRPRMSQVVVRLEFALEQQDNIIISSVPNQITIVADEVGPSNKENASSVSTEQPIVVASEHVQTLISLPKEKTNRKLRKSKIYKPLRFWTWDAFWNKVKPAKKKEPSLLSGILEADINLPKFDLATITAATNQFSTSHRVGHGGFGYVYKAVLPTGNTVAVKRFSYSRTAVHQFDSELLLVSTLHHNNIIKLIGYCIHEGGILLYEFMENGSLDKFIFDKLRSHQLTWSLRFKIITGVAKGVVYLHRDSGLRIIHRDLKSTNILLDTEMNPKISGFGFDRKFEDDQSEVETKIAGTLGYLAPEYMMEGRLSDKVDVFSFGLIVLETLSGMRNVGHGLHLIEQAWKLWKEGKALDLVDESIRGGVSEDEALRCIQVGLLCTEYDPNHRPTMASVLKMLLGEDLSLQEKITERSASHNAVIENEDPVNSRNSNPMLSFLFPELVKNEDNNDSTATFEYDSELER